jgi:pullulanase/glycogen debranching enzyme
MWADGFFSLPVPVVRYAAISKPSLSKMPEPTTKGRSSPLGATVSREGANFSVYSKHATGINSWFLNFSSRSTIYDETPCRVTLGTAIAFGSSASEERAARQLAFFRNL